MEGIAFVIWIIAFFILLAVGLLSLPVDCDKEFRKYYNMIFWITLIVKLILLSIVIIATLTSNIPAFTVLILAFIILLM